MLLREDDDDDGDEREGGEEPDAPLPGALVWLFCDLESFACPLGCAAGSHFWEGVCVFVVDFGAGLGGGGGGMDNFGEVFVGGGWQRCC